jgi:hypothetical protein
MESELYLDRGTKPPSIHFKKMQRLIAEYQITADIHVSRTLDQSYYETMENTAIRDRDQVVYRYTKGKYFHTQNVIIDDQEWVVGPSSSTTQAENGVPYKLRGREEETIAKLLMVNQLWLWKIDNSTYSIFY